MNHLFINRGKKAGNSLLSLRYKEASWHCRVLHSGLTEHEYCDDSGKPREHSHNVYHILLFTGPENEILLNGIPREIKRGSLLLCSPGSRHSFSPGRSGRVQYAEITFEYIRNNQEQLALPFCTLMQHLMNSSTLSLPDLQIVSEEFMNRFLNLFHKHFACLKNSSTSRFDEQLILAAVFQLVCQRQKKENRMNRAEQIRLRIEESLPGRINLNTLSDEFNLSKTALIRIYKTAFEITPMEYYRKTRLNMAAHMLRTSDRTFEDLSDLLGFCDVFHFMKSFRAEYGQTAGAYRKGHQI